MRIGSLFSGAGGLDMAVEQVFGAETIWHVENNPAASKVLAARWPDIPNHHDITTIDWNAVEPVDILCGGWPCQPFSMAGKRKGHEDERALWPYVARAIRLLRPRHVVLENVSAVLTAGEFQRVADNLAQAGYEFGWVCVRASDVGAPHRRERLFILAENTECLGLARAAGTTLADVASTIGWRSGHSAAAHTAEQFSPGIPPSDDRAALDTPRPGTGDRDCAGNPAAGVRLLGRGAGTQQGTVADSSGDGRRHQRRTQPTRLIGGSDTAQRGTGPVNLLPTPNASDGTGGGQHPNHREGHSQQLIDYVLAPEQWGKYEASIRPWEHATRPHPSPTQPNRNDNPRLNSAFSEWMMGWPEGWVTAVPGISRNDQLKIIGNGVVPQQAAHALTYLMAVTAWPMIS